MTVRRTAAQDGAPRLDLTGPLRVGALAAVVAAGGITALATLVQVDDGPVVSTTATIRSEPVAVRHESGGTLIEIGVRDGSTVKAGDRIARFDPRPIEAQIAALAKQINGKRLQMDGLRQEADAVASSAGADPARVARLQAVIADLDRDLVGLTTQMMFAEEALKHVDVRATVDGVVTEMAVTAPGVSVPARARLMSIRPAADSLVLTVPAPVWRAHASASGAPAQVRVRLAGGLPFSAPIAGRIEGAGDSGLAHGGDVRVTIDVAGTPLAELRDRRLAFDVQFVTRTLPLGRYLLMPIRRHGPAVGQLRDGAAS